MMNSNFGSSLFSNAYSSFGPGVNVATTYVAEGGRHMNNSGALLFLLPFFAAITLLVLVAVIFLIVSSWKVFKKAGQPGWAVLIPIYNTILLLRIIKKPVWWIVLCFIPYVNIFVQFVMVLNVAKVFGKGLGFAFGLFFLPFIFYPILAFGKAEYTEPIPTESFA